MAHGQASWVSCFLKMKKITCKKKSVLVHCSHSNAIGTLQWCNCCIVMVSTTYVAPKIFGTGFHILTDNCDKRSYCLEKLFMKYALFVEDTLASLGSLKNHF